MKTKKNPLDKKTLDRMDAWWRAANYLNIGQIYLLANPLLREPLKVEHIKPRLLGHWGTSPGLNLIYVHLNRLIKRDDLDVVYMAGPGHGGPALIANVWLEGTYSEYYPEITRDEKGMLKLFRQFSTPGGVPSHVSAPTPGSIHEGGELGYVLVHAFGAAFDNPNLIVAAVIGDGEAETGPLEGSWKGIKFLNAARDGAVLPILHLNGYKISGPTVWGRADDKEIAKFLEGHGYEAMFVEGTVPAKVHQQFAATLEKALAKIRAIQQKARKRGGTKQRPVWPAIVLRTLKGWTGPKVVDGLQIEGTFRAHQVPVSEVRTKPAHLKILEKWLKSYRPEELFDEHGRLRAELAELAPTGPRRMGANPHANGGSLRVPLALPDYTQYAVKFEHRAAERMESTRVLGLFLRDIFKKNAKQANFRLFCPDETNSNRLGAVFDVTDRCSTGRVIPRDDHVSAEGRVMEVLSEHCCQGWLEGYILTGRHGLFATYEAFAMVVDSMAMQHSKWLEECRKLPWRKPVPSLNYLLTSTCWRNDHNGFSHQGPGFIDNIVTKKPAVVRVYLPPDANCLLSVADHCLRSVSYLNLIVIDKQPQLQWLSLDEARAHCTRGAGVWNWCSHEPERPEVILACAGDIATLETVAAAALLREFAPELRFRVVNVVDLMTLCCVDHHPHGMTHADFNELFTTDKHVIFAFHGYPGVVHQLIHGRANTNRFHARGFIEEGTTTTPFDMVVLNKMSRVHLCLDILHYLPHAIPHAKELTDRCHAFLAKHRAYVTEHFEDLPEVNNWVWKEPGEKR